MIKHAVLNAKKSINFLLIGREVSTNMLCRKMVLKPWGLVLPLRRVEGGGGNTPPYKKNNDQSANLFS